jgi:hypothetical protein
MRKVTYQVLFAITTATAILAGCASTAPTKEDYSGYLGSYQDLKAVEGPKWREIPQVCECLKTFRSSPGSRGMATKGLLPSFSETLNISVSCRTGIGQNKTRLLSTYRKDATARLFARDIRSHIEHAETARSLEVGLKDTRELVISSG